MVKITDSILCALLATAVSAELRHDKRHHHHRRQAKNPCSSAASSAAALGSAPYPIGNGTVPAGPTGTGGAETSMTTTVSATSTLFSTITVQPVPVSSEGAGAGAGASPSGGAPASGPAGGAPGSGSSPTSGSGSGSGSGAGSGANQCGPLTVTVTAQNTVTVTAGQGGAASSVPAAGSSPAAESSPAAASSPAAVSSPAESSPAAASSPAAVSSPAAASPSTPAAGASSAAAAGSSPAAQSPPAASPSTPAASSPAASSAAAAATSNMGKIQSQPSATPASTSAAPSSSPVSSGNGGKCGVAYDGSNQVGGSGALGSGLSWAFNWNPSSGGNLPEGVEYVPSLQKPEWTSSLAAAVAQATGVTHILSLNEPDMDVAEGGTAVAPGDAVQYYQSTLNDLGKTYKIAAPAVTSYNTTSGKAGFESGLTWLGAFHEACGGNCQVDFVPLHWYAGAANGDAANQASLFLQYVDDSVAYVQSLYPNAEIWFNEFSAYPTADQDPQTNADFLNAVKPKLESNGAITRYAYYMASFLESGGSLNAAGQALVATGGSS